MALKILRNSAIAAGIAAMFLGAPEPALASGYSVHFGYHSGYYGPAHYGYGHHYRYGRHYKHHYGHRRSYGHHHGGGHGAAIALGVIGGAVILNELAEDRARRRADDRAYEERLVRSYDPYARRAAPLRADPRGYEGEDYDYYAPEGPGPRDGALGEDAIESRLEGGPAPIRISALDAYEACADHARRALRAQGFVLAMPAEPETVEDLGDAWKMTATILAEDRRGGGWSRAMYCEADEGRVYFLELI